jgi:hypothetical protein
MKCLLRRRWRGGLSPVTQIERIARVGFETARKRTGKLCSVDKANVLDVSRLWREVVTKMGEEEYPDVELTHMYVDNCAMQLIRNPKQFDTIVTGALVPPPPAVSVQAGWLLKTTTGSDENARAHTRYGGLLKVQRRDDRTGAQATSSAIFCRTQRPC